MYVRQSFRVGHVTSRVFYVCFCLLNSLLKEKQKGGCGAGRGGEGHLAILVSITGMAYYDK